MRKYPTLNKTQREGAARLVRFIGINPISMHAALIYRVSIILANAHIDSGLPEHDLLFTRIYALEVELDISAEDR